MSRRSTLIKASALLLAIAAVSGGVGASLAAFTAITGNTGSSLETDALAAAADLSASGNPDVTLSWTASTSDWASGYRIYRGTSAGGPYGQIGEVAGVATTSYNDTPGAGTFYYVVRAFLGRTTWTSPATREVGATTSGYRDAVLHTSGLVSYWRLGESTGPTANDSNGANTGSYQDGVTLGTAGALNEPDTAASFDGVGGHVDVPDAASLQPAQISVEAWVKGEAKLQNYDSVLMKAKDDSWSDGYGLYWTSDGNIHFFVNNWDRGDVITALPADQWTHIVGTYDGATIRLYKDGVEVDSLADASGINHSGAPLDIGRGSGAEAWNEFYWAGGIDEVAVYDVALDGSQVQAHYDAR
jgi:hypothetical protein